MKRWLAGFAVLAAGYAVYISFRWDMRAGMLLAGILILIASVWAIEQYRRRRVIRELSTQLRRLLSGSEVMDITQYEEGELAALSADIYKVMVAFREQAATLQGEKLWLADAISDISHQLKTPITSMLMLTDLLKKDLSEERRNQFIKQLSSQSVRLQWLVQSLLTLSKLDAQAIVYQLAPVTYRDLIEKAGEPLLIAMELKGQRLEVTGDLDSSLQVDRNWTAEAIGNVIKNASEHGPRDSVIRVEGSDRPMSRVIEVTNSGDIPANELPHLFTRFYRGSQAATDSVGIGLAISQAIIQQQGGQIEALSREGETTFCIRFPK